MIRLLPKPQQLQELEGVLQLDYRSRITLDDSCGSEELFCAKELAEELRSVTGLELMVDRRSGGYHKGILLCMDPAFGVGKDGAADKETYTLNIRPDMAVLCAGQKEGLFNAVQTMRQIIRQRGIVLPCLSIKDYPQLPVRGWFMDVTRGRIPRLSYLKEMADRCSLYKINQMHLYIEHTFLYDGLSEVWRDDTPLTAQDILELDAYCAERNIDLVPSVATFGHLYKVLRTQSFRELAEIEEPKDCPFSFYERMRHHTVNVTDDRSQELIFHLIDEYVPLFRSKLFNMNCDETFDLGKGRGKERAVQVGTHTMYLEWLNKVCAHVKALGKRPMFWGDIIAHDPQTIRELPEDILCLTWDYDPEPGDSGVRRLRENGAHQYLCPGVQGWNQTIHLLDIAYKNIKNMAKLAHQFAGEGLLTTDWGDYGHFQNPELSLVGIIYGACFGWNRQIPEEAAVNEDISILEYGDKSGRLVSILRCLSQQAVMHWGELVQFVETARYRIEGRNLEQFWESCLPEIEKKLSVIDGANEQIRLFCRKLSKLLPELTQDRKERIAPLLHMAEGQILINTILKVLEREHLNHPEAYLGDRCMLAADLEIWYYEYRRQWRKISRESELYRIGEVIFWLADYLRGSHK